MREKLLKIKDSRAVRIITDLLNWKFFPIITALWVVSCYYLGWDLVSIYFLVLTGIAMLILLKDLTPLLPHFLFMNVIISEQHSPLNFGEVVGSDYFIRTGNLVQIIILICLIVIAIFVRLFFIAKNRTYKPTPIFFGLCALSAAFILNGAGSSNYTVMDLVYGVFMAFFFLCVFVLIAGNIRLTEENYKKVCYGFLIFAALLMLELAIKYLTDFDKIFAGGSLNKQKIIMGWGVWNNFGMYFCICIPPVCLLASKSKYGYIYYLLATVLVACAFLTGSRQAMLGSVFAYIISTAALMMKSRTRLINLIIFCIALVGCAVVVAIKWDSVLKIINKLLSDIFKADGSYSGNGRMRLINLALDYFKANPLFGSGFFSEFESFELTGITGNIIPTFAHNTFAEILGTCGLFGILAYLGQRVLTLIGFLKKPTMNKFYLAASVLTMLVICMLDNYIFYMLPTLIYSSAMPFATGEEETAITETEQPKEQIGSQ